jgi:hypothetical protein
VPKSILDIDVHDEKFQKFAAAFGDFKDQADKLGAVWAQFSVETKKPRAAIDALDQAVGRAHRSSEKLAKTWATLGGHIESSDKRLSKFERSIKAVDRGLARVARLGMSIGKFALAAGGIGAFGGLFGMDVLANSAMNQQKAARGLGMPIGQVQAFKTYMQPYLSNPAGILQSIMNARRTPEGEAALAALGFNPAQYDKPNLNRMGFANEVLSRVRALYVNERKNNPDVPIESVLKAFRVQSLGLGVEDVRRLANTPQSELSAVFSREQSAALQDQLSNKTATAWAKLKIQLDQAGIAIRNDLIKHLVKLAPQIGMLSKKVEGLINTFLTNKKIGTFINDLSTDLSEAVGFLGSAKFKQDVESFASSVGTIAKAALKLSKSLGGFTERHETLLKDAGLGAVGIWAGSKVLSLGAKVYRGAKWIGSKFSDDAAAGDSVASDAGSAGLLGLSATGAALLGGVGGLFYSPSLGNGDLPFPKTKAYYTNPANWRRHNNPGNIDPVIDGTKYYRAFPSMAAGYRAIANRLLSYRKDTIGGLVTEYEGAGAKHLRAHIADISRWMKEAPDAKLNLSNTNTMAELVTGIARTEERHRMDNRQLYQTVREAIIDGMRTAASGGVRPTAQVANAMHAGRY